MSNAIRLTADSLTAGLPLAGAVPKIAKSDDPAKIRDAAQQFEALLIGQVLQAAHDGNGWLGTDGDSAGSCASGFAEQQLALAMARQGGFGLAGLIAQGLTRNRDDATAEAAPESASASSSTGATRTTSSSPAAQ